MEQELEQEGGEEEGSNAYNNSSPASSQQRKIPSTEKRSKTPPFRLRALSVQLDFRRHSCPISAMQEEPLTPESPGGEKFVQNYALKEIVGLGSYSKVREAYDVLNQKKVAVKIIRKSNLRNIKGCEQRIMNEIHILKKLHHVNVVQVKDTICQPHKIYIVMELAKGKSVQQLLDERTTSDRGIKLCKAHAIFQQVVAGLEYLHKTGIVHGDLKPENLLTSESGVLKISDFGASTDITQNGNSDLLTKASGTPAFLSPQALQGKYHGFANDIYQAGVCLFEMVTGYHPFLQSNTTAAGGFCTLLKGMTEAELKVPKWIAGSLKALISGMLERDEGKRITIDKIKSNMWFKHGPTSAETVPEFLHGTSSSFFDSLSKMLHINLQHNKDAEERPSPCSSRYSQQFHLQKCNSVV